MKITALERIPARGTAGELAAMRGTDGQDRPVAGAAPVWRRKRTWIVAIAAGATVLALLAWIVRAWNASELAVPAERLRVVTVTQEPFVRDVAAQGTVIAAVSPTLFAVAPGTVSYAVRAGDTVAKDQVLARLDSASVRDEYARERATLDSLNAALARQEIEIRRQILKSQQQADLARVATQAAERELKRAQWAWEQRAISERDIRTAEDEVEMARLNYEHARGTAGLERESLELELRTRRLERDRQALLVRSLGRRVEELEVRSPVAGMVANLAQAQQAKVPESAPLITVVDLGAFEIEFQVAETYAREIRPGMEAELTLDGRTHPGTVAAISPEVRQNQVIGRVRFARAQPPGLRQNQRAAVRIVLDRRERVMQFERGSLIDAASRSVYVVRGDRAVRTPVELGSASVAAVEVLRGLTPGDRVIVSDTRDFRGAAELAITE